MCERFIADEQLCIPAGGALCVDAITWLERRNVWTDPFDGAADVGSWRVWEIWFARVRAGADIALDGIHTDGVDANEELPGSRYWIGHLLEPHDVRGTKLFDDNRLHVSDCSRGTGPFGRAYSCPPLAFSAFFTAVSSCSFILSTCFPKSTMR